MGFSREITGYLKMDDKFEINVLFGLSMQCIFALVLALTYGVFYFYIGLFELLYLMVFMLVLSTGLLIYCRIGIKYRNVIVVAGMSIQSALIHILVTYYVGNSGTIFFIISSILIPHMYPLLTLRLTLVLDIFLVAVINFTLWISLNRTPAYADLVDQPYRFILSNIGLLICIMELFINIFSVGTLKEARERLVDDASKDAYLDALTGLGNRRMLSRQQSCLETESEDSMCLALVDIDFFKKINDTHGHAVGDKALVFLAETMKMFFRRGDLLIRWGGEEFLILLRYTELKNAENLMERFRKQIENSVIQIDGGELCYTVTIGLTEHIFDTPLSDTISIVDELLYQGKSAGRNRIVVKSQN